MQKGPVRNGGFKEENLSRDLKLSTGELQEKGLVRGSLVEAWSSRLGNSKRGRHIQAF